MLFKTSIIIVLLSLTARVGKSQELSLRKVKLNEVDQDEREFLINFNKTRVEKGIGSIELSIELSKIAQSEAERLSRLGRVELPKFNLAKNYYGFSFKRNGKIGNIYVGYRMCHNNLLNILDLNVYGLNHDCNPNGIDYNFTYEMGYGRAFDRLGNIYSVRLFYTSQERHVNTNQELIVSPQKVSLEDHDEEENEYINSYNMSRIESYWEPLKNSTKLMNVAKNEARRLAKLGKLEFPKKDLRKAYFGESFKIVGKIDDNYVGFKICHDSIVHSEDKNFYSIEDNCLPNGIDEKTAYYVGFGSALDKNGNIFKVRIFSSAKEEDESLSEKNKRKSSKKKRRLRKKHRRNKVRIYAELE